MSDLDKSEEESTHINDNDSFSYDSPPRPAKKESQLQSAQKEATFIRRKELEGIIMKVRDDQIEELHLANKRMRQLNLRMMVGLPLGVIILLVVCLFFFFDKINNLQARIVQLQHWRNQAKDNIGNLHQLVRRQKQFLLELSTSLEEVKEEIYDIHMNELIKQEKSIHIFKKYSQKFKFQVDPSINNLHKHYKISSPRFRKKSQEQRMFFSGRSIPESGIYFMQVKIVETLYGMISFGIIPEDKRGQECVYCDTANIFYIYCQNGNVYNGQYLSISLDMLHRSKATRFKQIRSGDVISMFVDNNEKMVIWYVNNRYAGSESFREVKQDMYPFIEMTSSGDEVIVIE